MTCFSSQNHYLFMQEAIAEAKKAFAEDEIPVGALLVKNNTIILKEHNRSQQLANPLAHCEKLLIDKILTSEPGYRDWETDRKSTRLNSSHITRSRMPSSA